MFMASKSFKNKLSLTLEELYLTANFFQGFDPFEASIYEVVSSQIPPKDHFLNLKLKMQLELDFFKSSQFGDKRLDKKGHELLTQMMTKQTVILNRLAEGRNDLISYHRFFNNKRVEPAKLIEAITDDCVKQVKGKKLICFQDTSEYNYQRHAARIKEGELGPTGNDKDIGFFAHPMLVMDAAQKVCIGIGDLVLWHRKFDKEDKYARGYKKLPIEEKESFRWIASCERTKQRLHSSEHITFIADREADIYELWDRVPDDRTDLIIRCRSDRNLYGEKESLFTKVSSQVALGSYQIEVKENKKKGRSKHVAELEVRSARIKIKRPESLRKGQHADYIELTVVEAREKESTVKEGEPPVHWYLLTTKSADSFEPAKEIIEDYSQRWQIEQLFRVSKHQGLDMEASQMETGQGLMNMCVLALQVSMKILQLTQGRDNEDVPAKIAFNKKQIALLEKVEKKYEGKTEAQKNPYQKHTLSWSAWIIARLGGWKGYRSQSTPGPITFYRGLVEFDRIFMAWTFLKQT